MPNAHIQNLMMKMADELEREISRAIRKAILESELVKFLEGATPENNVQLAGQRGRAKPSTLCSREGCGRNAFVKGLCRVHLKMDTANKSEIASPNVAVTNGDANVTTSAEVETPRSAELPATPVDMSVAPTPDPEMCKLEGCSEPVHSRGMCRRHFFDWVDKEWARTRVQKHRLSHRKRKAETQSQSESKELPQTNAAPTENLCENPPASNSLCKEPGCDRKVHAKRQCKRHFMMWVQKQRYAKTKGEPSGSEAKVIASDPAAAPESSAPISDSPAIKAYVKPAIREIEATATVHEPDPAEVIPIPRIIAFVEDSIADVVPLFPAQSSEEATVVDDIAPVDFVGEPEIPVEIPSMVASASEVPMPTAIKDPSRCKEPGCQRVIHANALCHQHYYAWVAKQFEEKWGGESASTSNQVSGPVIDQGKFPATTSTATVTAESTPTESMSSLCSHPGCSGKIHAKGMCGRHFMEWVREKKKPASRNPDERKHINRMVPNCSHESCGRPAFRKGLCGTHFMEWVRAKSGGARKAEEASHIEEQVESQSENGSSLKVVKPEQLDRVPFAAESQDLPIQVERIKTCAFPGCGRKVRHQRFCAKHRKIPIDGASRDEEQDEAEAVEPSESIGTEVVQAKTVLRRANGNATISGDDELAHCTQPGCDRKVFTKGLCANHYMEERKRNRQGIGPVGRMA